MPTNKGKKLFEFAIIADSHLNPAEGGIPRLGRLTIWQTNVMKLYCGQLIVYAHHLRFILVMLCIRCPIQKILFLPLISPPNFISSWVVRFILLLVTMT